MKSLIPSITCLLGFSGILTAAVEFDRVFGSHMVLQQNQPIVFSGKAEPNVPVTVEFSGKSVVAKPDRDGMWTVTFPAQPANAKGQSVKADQKESTASLEDVLIGEVWVASGQSNMLWRLNQTPSGKKEIPASSNDQLRIFHNTPQVHVGSAPYTDKDFEKLTPEKFYQGSWQISSPASSAPCSAVAYYFAKDLQKTLGIPVGIIHSSLGGSEMAAWIPKSEITANPAFASLKGNRWLESKYLSGWVRERARQNLARRANSGEPEHPYKPGFLYETGMEWVTKLPVAGVIWYQGEADVGSSDSTLSIELMNRLIKTWQQAFKQKELPFMMVQLPRINDNAPLRAYWPEFREAQLIVARSLPGTEVVNTIDLGSENSDVHPPEKMEVAKRMANLVANRIYKKPIEADFPEMKKWIAKGDKIHLSLDHADGLKTTDGQEPACFEVAGSDGKYHAANAAIGKNGLVTLSSPEVTSPRSARYCWATFVKPNLVNKNDLPLFPFRTTSSKK